MIEQLEHQEFDFADLRNQGNRCRMAKMVMKLFELWQNDTAAQLDLLGLAPESRSSLSRYRRGEPLPASRDLLERASYLHRSLHFLFPENPELRHGWINLRNRDFENETPLRVIRRQGLVGLARIASHLDHLCSR